MRITVLGAIMVIAAAIVIAIALQVLFDNNNQGPRHDQTQ